MKVPLGTRTLNDGYWRVKTSRGWRLEHRVVMEAILGRPLLSSELVHHRDGTRTNNRPDNLELTGRGPHIGHHNKHRPVKLLSRRCVTCRRPFTGYMQDGRPPSYCSRECYRASPIMKKENARKAMSGGLASAKKRWGWEPA